MLKLITTALLIISSGFASIQAQAIPHPSEKTLTAMKKLEAMAGKWTGEGWMQSRDFRAEFTQEEDIYSKLNGSVLEINGLALSKLDGDTVHHAMAIISYDEKEEQYKMYAMRGDGQAGHVKAHMNDAGAFIWEMDAPQGGRIQYIISFDEQQWHESGRFSPNGSMWYDFFEMKLTKKEDR